MLVYNAYKQGSIASDLLSTSFNWNYYCVHIQPHYHCRAHTRVYQFRHMIVKRNRPILTYETAIIKHKNLKSKTIATAVAD